MFKGHGNSTAHKKWCKICIPDPFPQGMHHHTPGLVFCAAMKPILGTIGLQGMAFLQPAARSAHMENSKMACWTCSEVAYPCDRLPRRLSQAVPNMEAARLMRNPLSNILDIPMLFLGLTSERARHNQAKETQGGLQELFTVAFDFLSAS